ncbi:hypothetical protein K4F52_000708 [Lecanicillium sp. MT-2017a]|nr:hypothetical protein K4F52_000708 [Lecanicillium sp. MT-2017a]
MAAINSVAHPGLVMHEMAKRGWPAQNVGVMVVFCIVFVVGVALVGLGIHKFLKKRKDAKPAM